MQVRADPRRAGDTLRYPTWPVLQPQTNAHHTWNVMRILVTIWPDAPAPALVAALFHDAGELGSGDIPYPHKRDNPTLKSIMDALEEKSLRDQGVQVPQVVDVWRMRIKVCDCVEMLEKGLDELALGNCHGRAIVLQMEEMIYELTRTMSWPDRIAIDKYIGGRFDLHRAKTQNMEGPCLRVAS